MSEWLCPICNQWVSTKYLEHIHVEMVGISDYHLVPPVIQQIYDACPLPRRMHAYRRMHRDPVRDRVT